MQNIGYTARFLVLDGNLASRIIATVRSSADERVHDYLQSLLRKLSSLSAADGQHTWPCLAHLQPFVILRAMFAVGSQTRISCGIQQQSKLTSRRRIYWSGYWPAEDRGDRSRVFHMQTTYWFSNSRSYTKQHPYSKPGGAIAVLSVAILAAVGWLNLCIIVRVIPEHFRS